MYLSTSSCIWVNMVNIIITDVFALPFPVFWGKTGLNTVTWVVNSVEQLYNIVYAVPNTHESSPTSLCSCFSPPLSCCPSWSLVILHSLFYFCCLEVIQYPNLSIYVPSQIDCSGFYCCLVLSDWHNLYEIWSTHSCVVEDLGLPKYDKLSLGDLSGISKNCGVLKTFWTTYRMTWCHASEYLSLFTFLLQFFKSCLNLLCCWALWYKQYIGGLNVAFVCLYGDRQSERCVWNFHANTVFWWTSCLQC
jgi:hypothetical protein